jgi:2'-5' RNA ligase
MRLFVAVDLSAEAIAEASRVADDIRTRYPRVRLRWIPASNMHLTVRFVGQVRGDPDGVVAALVAPAPVAPFRITLGNCGAFPSSGAIRVVWIGLAAGIPELMRLNGHVDDRLRPFGFEPESRPFSPHLTLARVERDHRVPREVRDVLSQLPVRPIGTQVTHAVLYRSHLSPRGSRYEALADIPFAGPSGASA